MEFLYFARPTAFGSTAPIPIPLVTTLTHQPSAGPFIDFPRQLGFSFKADHTQRLDIDAHSTHEVTVLLQSWLFFGLLAEFLGTAIDIQAFISAQNNDDGQRIDLAILENLLVEWNDRIQSMQGPARAQYKERIQQCLDLAVLQSEQLDYIALDPTSSHFPAIALSVKLLILVLGLVARTTLSGTGRSSVVKRSHVHRPPHRPFLPRLRFGRSAQLKWTAEPAEPKKASLLLPLPAGVDVENAPPGARLLIDRMLETGWCIHVVRKLCRLYDYAIVNFLSLLRRGTDPSISHEICREATHCIANNVSLAGNLSYKTRHTDPECQCSFLKVDTDGLIDIIRDGGIPLVLVTQGTQGFRIRLVRREPRTRYVAISHVWSDGLGNPIANSLPECQINRLWNHVRRDRAAGDKVGGPTSWSVWSSPLELIWMDTLCIPVGPADNAMIQEVKSRAINNMAPIYADACIVYVLDFELQRLNVYTGTPDLLPEEVSPTDLSGYLLCSAWMGRTWTLQEGMLARTCHYLLTNCSYSLESQWKAQRGDFDWRTRLRLIFNLHRSKPIRRGDAREGAIWSSWLDLGPQSGSQKRDSPLSHVRTEFDRLMCANSARALNLDIHDMRHAASKPTSQPSSWRATQFTKTWNSLLDRSTTKPEDQHGIFATLLDFSPCKVRSLEATKRMPAMIRSCNELPLSLLFNSGPRLPHSEPPENGWIPSEIVGDSLIDTPVLTQTPTGWVLANESNEMQTSLDPLYIFKLGSAVTFAQAFRLQDTQSGLDYFVQIRSTSERRSSTPYDDLSERLNLALEAGKETCIIFDKRSGTSSLSGFLAAGVWLSISRTDAKRIFVRYICPVIVRTRASFERTRQEHVDPVLIRAKRCQDWEQVILEYNPQACGEGLIRRPGPRDDWAWPVEFVTVATWIISLGCSVLILYLIARKQQRSGHSYVALISGLSVPFALFSTWLAGYVSLVCQRAYIEAWFATFDEHWQAPEGPQWYQWFRWMSKVPSVLRRADSEIYRREKFRDREDSVHQYIDRCVQSAIHALGRVCG